MNDMDIVMLSGWDGEHSEKIKTLFNKSGLIFLHPGNGFKLSGFNSLFSNSESNPWAGEIFYWQSLENPLGLRVTAPYDNVFKIFGDGEYGDPGKGLFHGRFMVPPFAGRPEDLLISYEDDVPALVRFSDPGIIYFWNIPLGENFSNWAKQLEYLPLLAEMIIDARAKCRPVPVETGHMPGDLLTCLLLYDTSSGTIELYSKDKKQVPTEKDTAAERGVKYVSIPVISPGIYTWQRDHMAFEYDAVNFPSAESDLRTMTPGEIRKTGWDRLKGGYQARDLHEGISVWPYLLALAAGLALLEGYMAFKLSEIK